MRKTLIIAFCVLLIFNIFYAYKYLDSIRQQWIEYVKEDCFLRFNKGIVDVELDTISINNGFIKTRFINELGIGCKNVDFIDSCEYLKYKVKIDSDKFNIDGLILPIDSVFSDKYDKIENSNLWIIHSYRINLKNCGRIIGYRTLQGDTIRLKHSSNLLLGDLKIDRQENKVFKYFYIGLLILNLIVLTLIIYIKRIKK